VFLVKRKSAAASCVDTTLRTCPWSGQAALSSQLRHLQLLACHSRAALACQGLIQSNVVLIPGIMLNHQLQKNE